MISIWEKQSFLKSDILVLGAGITGLSVAATLKEKNPSLSVTILERGIIPRGASTKNAGFACFGSVSELANDMAILGEQGMVKLVEKRRNGLQKTIYRLGKESIDLQIKSGYELIFDHTIIDQIDAINNLLFSLFNENVFGLSDSKIDAYGFAGTQHLVENKFEGQLDTGKLIDSLWKYCTGLGVKIHTGCSVTGINESGEQVEAKCNELRFSTQHLAICTNAFSKSLINENINLKPGRGMVMAISPKNPLAFEGTFHYHQGYYYFRDYYGKLLFGGGRELDLEKEETLEFGINYEIRKKLIDDLEKIILPEQNYEIETEWSGIMAFGDHKKPIVKRISDRISVGVRLGGMGVAIGSLVGEEVANLILEKNDLFMF